MMLCRSDITSKNEKKVERIKQNFYLVEAKMKLVAEKDNLRNWQPPINGNDILNLFIIEKPQQIGLLKNAVREAILDDQINDEFEACIEFLKEFAFSMGIKEKTLEN